MFWCACCDWQVDLRKTFVQDESGETTEPEHSAWFTVRIPDVASSTLYRCLMWCFRSPVFHEGENPTGNDCILIWKSLDRLVDYISTRNTEKCACGTLTLYSVISGPKSVRVPSFTESCSENQATLAPVNWTWTSLFCILGFKNSDPGRWNRVLTFQSVSTLKLFFYIIICSMTFDSKCHTTRRQDRRITEFVAIPSEYADPPVWTKRSEDLFVWSDGCEWYFGACGAWDPQHTSFAISLFARSIYAVGEVMPLSMGQTKWWWRGRRDGHWQHDA
jgi:hypothetical protein